MADLVGSPDIILLWPIGRELAEPTPVPGYSIRALPAELDSWWIDIHRKAVPVWRREQLEAWLDRYRSLALKGGILVATEDSSGEPVATAGSIANSKKEVSLNGGQIAWVATVPEHRGLGLANWLCAVATQRLLQGNFQSIFLCTGDDMPAAISVYLRLGYIPYLYASDQEIRWKRICKLLEFPFTPEKWMR